MKRILSVCLAFVMIFATACSGKETEKTKDDKKQTTTSANESETKQENDEKTDVVDMNRPGEMRDLTATELISEMKAGWNLGNSLDANGGETAWGNPKTTKEMIDAIADKGFNTIRIPVTWGDKLGEGPDYIIKKEWLDRVQEVVNYAIDNDMYVIINSHHEEDWRIPDYENIEVVTEITVSIWEQVAERFKDYGDHLIFEGLNEPRIKGGEKEWSGGTEEGRDCVNRLNEAFIKVVRESGGNNTQRTLLITTFAAQPNLTGMKELKLPDDDNVGISIHAYTPYRFTYDSPDESWNTSVFDDQAKREIEKLFYDLQEMFLEKGYPVIITEFGAVNKDITDKDEEVVKWVTHYMSTGKKFSIPCIWWDNGYYVSGNELFGIFDRVNVKWYSDEIADAMVAVYEE